MKKEKIGLLFFMKEENKNADEVYVSGQEWYETYKSSWAVTKRAALWFWLDLLILVLGPGIVYSLVIMYVPNNGLLCTGFGCLSLFFLFGFTLRLFLRGVVISTKQTFKDFNFSPKEYK